MTSPAPPSTLTPIASFRVLVTSLISALVVFAIVLGLVLGWGMPPLWALAVPLVLGALAQTLVSTVGFRVEPIAPGTAAEEATRLARARFQTSAILRFAVSESVAIISMVLAFAIRPQSVLVYLVGCIISIGLMGRYVWPTDRVLARTEAALDAAGGRSFLADVMAGREPGTTAAGYQQL